MKARDIQEFSRELIATERLGCLEVSRLCTEAIEKWGVDCFALSDLVDLLLQETDRVAAREDDLLTGTFLMLYQNACDFARNHLSREGYHYFCERQTKTYGYWY